MRRGSTLQAGRSILSSEPRAPFVEHPLRMETQYCMDSVDFTRRWWQAMEILYQVAFALVFYVCFLALFYLAIRHLWLHKVSGGRSMVALTSVMFVFATAQLVLSLVLSVYVLQLLRLDVEGNSRKHATLVANRITYAQDIFLTTNNAFTDSLFIRRCYVVWGRRKLIITVPILMLAATTVLGYVSAIQIDQFNKATFSSIIPFAMAAVTNVLLTTLTAGRIWWAGKEVRRNLRESFDKDYSVAAAMCLESGAIYSFFVIAFIITGILSAHSAQSSGSNVINNLLAGALPQAVNIVPIIIMVRVGLIRGVETTSSESESPNPDLSFVSIRLGSFSNSD
ncbi:hypothetical protein MSAN_01494600 [Mycena sanguinolenta]|uniref:Uncharacterized protein n=1 Tax=Mycena sanguinolenta TaxID=230812 RepID=A0A8H7D1B1_9AGAR|nr:hypothetical protein MSAN_01494600 [Mycena sanguinolenta]